MTLKEPTQLRNDGRKRGVSIFLMSPCPLEGDGFMCGSPGSAELPQRLDGGLTTTPAWVLLVLLSFNAIHSFTNSLTPSFIQQIVLDTCSESGRTSDLGMAQFPVQRCPHSRDRAEAQDGISGSMFPNLRPWQCGPCCKWLLPWKVHNPWFPP